MNQPCSPTRSSAISAIRSARRTCGSLIGDLSLNREARLVVMTTGIICTILHAEIDHPNDDPLAEGESVVLDECHGMNDNNAAPWEWSEESIIPWLRYIQLVVHWAASALKQRS